MKNNVGFTLIEVLISLAILAFISLSIYQGTTQTFRMRDVVIQEGDFYNGIRLSMGILERDLNLMFTPKEYLPPPPKKRQPGGVNNGNFSGSSRTNNNADEEENLENDPDFQSSDLAKTTEFWLAATNKAGVKLSRFTGEADKLSFVSASHQRLYKDRLECDFVKITYELRDEKNNDDAIENTKTLYKIIDTNVFTDEDKKKETVTAYPLLPGIKKIGFRYYSKEKDEWDKNFDNSKEDVLKRGKYPELVEVTIEVTGGKKLNFEGIYILKPGLNNYDLQKTF